LLSPSLFASLVSHCVFKFIVIQLFDYSAASVKNKTQFSSVCILRRSILWCYIRLANVREHKPSRNFQYVARQSQQHGTWVTWHATDHPVSSASLSPAAAAALAPAVISVWKPHNNRFTFLHSLTLGPSTRVREKSITMSNNGQSRLDRTDNW